METKRYTIKYDHEGRQESTEDIVAREVRLFLYVSEVLEHCFECSPCDMETLVIGYLYVEGILDDPKQIDGTVSDWSKLYRGIEVQQTESGDCEIRLSVRREQKLRSLQQVRTLPGFKADLIMRCEALLLESSKAFRETGCIHAAGLYELYTPGAISDTRVDETELQGVTKYFGEDISRYYAMYKAVGKALSAGSSLSDMCLCTTGRLPMGYMERVIRAGILCVVSRSAPTDAALSLAEKYGVMVFGFAGKARVNLYPTLTGCAILAGGTASRLDGADKAQLEVNGKTMLTHIMEQLPKDMTLFLSYNRSEGELKMGERVYRVLKDQVEHIGPLGGIHTVLTCAKKDGYVRLLIVACDMPWYNMSITDVLMQVADEETDAVVIRTRDGRTHPLCGIYRINCLPVIEQMIEEKNYKLQILLDRVRTKYLSADEASLQEKWFTNVNTSEDYRVLQSE